jgi:hypothetical protein
VSLQIIAVTKLLLHVIAVKFVVTIVTANGCLRNSRCKLLPPKIAVAD